MGLLDKLAKAFGFKSDDDLKRNESKKRKKKPVRKNLLMNIIRIVRLTGNWLLNTVNQSLRLMRFM